MMRDSEIQQIAERVLKDRFASAKILDCKVETEEDFDGEEIVRITAVSEIPVEDARARLDANTAIHDTLRQLGDNRYVFLDIDVSSHEPDIDEDEQSLPKEPPL